MLAADAKGGLSILITDLARGRDRYRGLIQLQDLKYGRSAVVRVSLGGAGACSEIWAVPGRGIRTETPAPQLFRVRGRPLLSSLCRAPEAASI